MYNIVLSMYSRTFGSHNENSLIDAEAIITAVSDYFPVNPGNPTMGIQVFWIAPGRIARGSGPRFPEG